jgi:hypothetical protein
MEIICEICNKKYASNQSRSNHIRKYHKVTDYTDVHNDHKKVTNLVEENVDNVSIMSTKNNICKFCNKELCNRKSRWRHEQKCKEKYNVSENNNDLKENTEMKELKEELKELKNILLNTIKIHPSKLKKINNQLINNTNTNSNNTNNIGTINNINNNIIIPLSQQNLVEVLKQSEKLNIISSGNLAHLKLTDLLYKNPAYEKYRNIYITNLSNDIGYIYDSKENRFIVKSKKDILDDFGTERFSDIELFYNELKDKISEEKLNKMKKMVKSYFDNKDFKEVKNKELLISLYNNKINVKKIYDKINTKEIEI